ncbi:peptide chain release factor N(5)-glutamine methyltransferase [Pedobacter sp. BS3]|nr:peptide chain release factor N(5)-glutamine methyltransferase [Pedobacter sp. BS3]
MTFAETISLFKTTLSGLYDVSEARELAYYTLSHFCGLSRPQLVLKGNEPLDSRAEQEVIRVLEALRSGKPVQYILGEATFFGLTFKVNPAVLIPRPETEELVSWIIEEMNIPEQPATILDIGTGSGCIPISLKTKFPRAQVSAMDISAAALDVARQNAALNQVSVGFHQDDILNPAGFLLGPNTYSVIVSNPPYIAETEKSMLSANVLHHEPATALFVPDAEPLLFYRAIAGFALQKLNRDGMLFFEINERFGNETISLLKDKGFTVVELRKDLNGKDRMVKAMR